MSCRRRGALSPQRRHLPGELFEIRIDNAVRHQRHPRALEIVERRTKRAGGVRDHPGLFVDRQLACILRMIVLDGERERDQLTVARPRPPIWADTI